MWHRAKSADFRATLPGLNPRFGISSVVLNKLINLLVCEWAGKGKRFVSMYKHFCPFAAAIQNTTGWISMAFSSAVWER